ncbi:MAG: hypothetical protein IPM23_09770 [Candidatus Melainabacteria bacterium]|nr:hypothetical protein [Candidatus Melainabacteria bacterium]
MSSRKPDHTRNSDHTRKPDQIRRTFKVWILLVFACFLVMAVIPFFTKKEGGSGLARRVYAARAIAADTILKQDDLEEREIENREVEDRLPSANFVSLSQAVGKRLTHDLAEGEALERDHLAPVEQTPAPARD